MAAERAPLSLSALNLDKLLEVGPEMGGPHRLNGGCRVRDAPSDPTGGLCLGLYPGHHLQESDLTDPFGTLRSHVWEFLLPDRWNPDTKGFPSHRMTLFLSPVLVFFSWRLLECFTY